MLKEIKRIKLWKNTIGFRDKHIFIRDRIEIYTPKICNELILSVRFLVTFHQIRSK